MKFEVINSVLPEEFKSYYLVDKRGNKTLMFKNGDTYSLNRKAKMKPTKHLFIYKIVKSLIYKLLKLQDSNFFKYE